MKTTGIVRQVKSFFVLLPASGTCCFCFGYQAYGLDLAYRVTFAVNNLPTIWTDTNGAASLVAQLVLVNLYDLAASATLAQAIQRVLHIKRLVAFWTFSLKILAHATIQILKELIESSL